MRQITDIVLHETDTPTGRAVSPEDVDSWHGQRNPPFNRAPAAIAVFNPNLKHMGYHYLIDADGSVYTGRALAEVGAHCPPNGHSIGIALAGKGQYSPAQWQSLSDLVSNLLGTFPNARVTGHCEWESAKVQGKTCPDFDVQAWLAGGMEPLEGHVA